MKHGQEDTEYEATATRRRQPSMGTYYRSVIRSHSVGSVHDT